MEAKQAIMVDQTGQCRTDVQFEIQDPGDIQPSVSRDYPQCGLLLAAIPFEIKVAHQH